MSNKTMEEFRNAVLSELSEAANSAIAVLPSGQSTNGVAISAENGMLTLLNEAKDELTKRALPLACVGTKTVADGDGPAFALSGFMAANIKVMRNADTVTFTPSNGSKTLLTRMSPDALNCFYYDRSTAPKAAAKYWAYSKNDPRSIEFHRTFNSAGTLTVSGYGIPADATDPENGTFPWLSSDDEPAIVLYAAVMLTQRASDDPRLTIIRNILSPRLDAVMLAIRNRVSPVVQASYLDMYVPFTNIPSAGSTG